MMQDLEMSYRGPNPGRHLIWRTVTGQRDNEK